MEKRTEVEVTGLKAAGAVTGGIIGAVTAGWLSLKFSVVCVAIQVCENIVTGCALGAVSGYKLAGAYEKHKSKQVVREPGEEADDSKV